MANPIKEGEIREPTASENRCMVELMILRNNLTKRGESLKDRLAATKGGWRDLKLIMTLIDKLQDALYATVPPKTLKRYYWLATNGQVHVDVPGPIQKDGFIGVELDDLDFISAHAICGTCAVCMKEGKDIKRCKLRQALTRVAPQETLGNQRIMGCPYVDVAQKLILEREDEVSC